MSKKKKVSEYEIKTEVNVFMPTLELFTIMTDEEITDCIIAAIPSRSEFLTRVKDKRQVIKADLEKHGGAS